MLTEGTDVGGRFRVEGPVGSEGDGHLYQATDLRTMRQAVLWVVPSDLLGDPLAFEEVRASVKAAISLSHRNIVPTFGIGREADGAIYIARENIDGVTLNQLMPVKANSGKSFSPRGAYNVLSTVCGALSYAHPKLVHGVLTPESVLIGRNGRILVADLGLAPLLSRFDSTTDGPLRPYLAPEVLDGELPTERSDVYSLTALLYFMVCGFAPRAGGTPPPSRAQPLLPAELDDFVTRNMSSSATNRLSDPRALRSQLLALVETWGAPKVPLGEEWPFNDELTISSNQGKTTMPSPPSKPSRVSDIPISWADPPPPSDESAEVRELPPEPPGAAAPPVTPSRRVAAMPPPPGPGLGPSGANTANSSPISFDLGPPAPPRAGSEGSGEMIDLGSLISEVTQAENQIWMVHKNGFDHGPFSARELAREIVEGRVSDDDIVLNMETGVRQRCALWPELAEILEQARIKRRQQEEAAAAERVQTVEKRVGALTYLIVAGIVLLVGAGIGSYFLYRNATRDRTEGGDQLADLVEAGEVNINTGAGILPMEPTKTKRRRGRRRTGRRSEGRGGLTAEEAMALGVDYGDLTGPTTQLTVGQINTVMNRNARRFYPCLAGHTGRVNLDFVINGDGSVAGVSVPGATGPMRSCMASAMRRVRFPSFSAPRMRASFYFEVGR